VVRLVPVVKTDCSLEVAMLGLAQDWGRLLSYHPTISHSPSVPNKADPQSLATNCLLP
jgi:hypothetical protein